MSFNLKDKVTVVDTKKIKNDIHLEEDAFRIIEKSNYTGEVTKIENGINFVGFKNDLGWVTQGFKDNEIKGVK